MPLDELPHNPDHELVRNRHGSGAFRRRLRMVAPDRTTWLSGARRSELEDCPDAVTSGLVAGVCWTSQPERYNVAFRRRGTLRDHGPSAEAMLADMPTRWPLLHGT